MTEKPTDLAARERRDNIPRHTIEQQPASIYFRLAEDPAGAWVTYANHNAIVSKLEDRIIALTAALSAQGAPQGWEPIATAPKDGTSVLLWFGAAKTPRYGIGKWARQDWPQCWEADDGSHYVSSLVTHWMPLPVPPTGETR